MTADFARWINQTPALLGHTFGQSSPYYVITAVTPKTVEFVSIGYTDKHVYFYRIEGDSIVLLHPNGDSFVTLTLFGSIKTMHQGETYVRF